MRTSKVSLNSEGFFLYMFKCHNVFKIGKTQNIRSRLNGVRGGCPWKVYPVFCWEYDNLRDMDLAESVLHEYLREYRHKGEWFALSSEQVKYLCSLSSDEVLNLYHGSFSDPSTGCLPMNINSPNEIPKAVQSIVKKSFYTEDLLAAVLGMHEQQFKDSFRGNVTHALTNKVMEAMGLCVRQSGGSMQIAHKSMAA